MQEIAWEIRKRIIKIASIGRSGHIATSLSATDILTELYFDNILRYDAKNPDWTERDRFVLSKGHASLLLYNILAKAGYFEYGELKSYCQPGTKFGSHPTIAISGVEASTGALGHGYSYAVGLAIAGKMDKKDYLIYVLLGDGECQEGSIWEAATSAVSLRLNNLITIIDFNRLQATDFTENIVDFGDFAKRWEACGFEVMVIDGHNYKEIREALAVDRNCLPKYPRVVIANTIKGKGISMLENNPEWHSKIPNQEELEDILKEMGITREEFDRL